MNKAEYIKALRALLVLFHSYFPDIVDEQVFTCDKAEEKYKRFYKKLEKVVSDEIKKEV